MMGNMSAIRIDVLGILLAILALAGPAVAEVSIEMDRGLVCPSAREVNGTVTIGYAPVAQTVMLTSSHRVI